MKSVPKLIRRYIGILLLTTLLIIILNFILIFTIFKPQQANSHPWQTAEEVASTLQRTEDNGFVLPKNLALELETAGAWAIFIENATLQVVWQTDNLPETVPLAYTVSGIANLTRGYIDGYPTFTGEAADGLAVIGYPRESFWKNMWPSWDYDLIANIPKTVPSILAINAAFIFFIYAISNSRLLKSVKPIVNGIQDLPTGEPVYVTETGVLSELAISINKTSEILQSKNVQLRKKETARANWIAGVSHDIRTPLSMVMGYADQLKESPHLTKEEQGMAAVIVSQSGRIKNLINDLNLASKLEYNMQPVHPAKVNLIAIVRQVAADFINMDPGGRHPVIWDTDEGLTKCLVHADKNLIRRAVSNLIQNSMNHNEQGCSIHVSVTASTKECCVTVADDGIGTTDERISLLNHTPHYMVCDENTTEQRHGLGLLIVKQITAAHNGSLTIGHSPYGGFEAVIKLPLLPDLFNSTL